MVKKSKFVTFILSFVPGLGHFYLGLMERGLTFILGFFGWIACVSFLAGFSHWGEFMFLMAVLPVIWVYSLFDALKLCDKISRQEEVKDRSIFSEFNENIKEGSRSKSWALIFSVLPGGGHLYWGLKQEGLQLMGAFFLALFLLDWLHLSIFLFALPLIWFYSFFDALQFRVEEEEEERATKKLLPLDNPKYLGYLLIFVGCFIIFEKIISPFLDWRIMELIKTSLVAVLFIAGGVKLLLGSKSQSNKEEM